MRTWTMTVAASAALLTAVGSAGAVERTERGGPVDLKIADDVTNGRGVFSGVDYATSERFGRAWLVLHYQYQGSCPMDDGMCELDAPVNVSVPGLGYDAAAKQVVYQEPGAEPVVCASVRHHGFPRFSDSVDATGACTFRLEKVDRVVDDGFSGRRDRREEIHFAIPGRGADAGPGAVAGASR